jgi:MSHA biogenesis protein MshN
MSLINDMLRNLETQRPDDLARHNLQREIRALPSGQPGSGRYVRYGLMLLPLVGIGAALLHFDGRLLPMLGIEAKTPVTAAVPAEAPAIPAAPAVVPPAESVVPAVPEAAGGATNDELRLSPSLSVLPTTVAPVLPLPDPVPPPKLESKPAAVEAPVPTASSAPAKIEKSPVAATPRERAEVEFRRGESAQQAGRGAEAIEALRLALKIDPVYVPPRQFLVRMLLEQRKVDDAMAVLQEGLELLPQQTGWAMSLARLQLERGNLPAADATLTRSQGYAEANADYAGFQGHLKSRMNAASAAVGHYQRATRLAPGEGRWWLGLGLALEQDGRAGEAREAFRRAMASGSLNGDLTAVAEQHLRQ